MSQFTFHLNFPWAQAPVPKETPPSRTCYTPRMHSRTSRGWHRDSCNFSELHCNCSPLSKCPDCSPRSICSILPPSETKQSIYLLTMAPSLWHQAVEGEHGAPEGADSRPQVLGRGGKWDQSSNDVGQVGRWGTCSSRILPLKNCEQDMYVYACMCVLEFKKREIKLYLLSPVDSETIRAPMIIHRLDLVCIYLPHRHVLGICPPAARKPKGKKAIYWINITCATRK